MADGARNLSIFPEPEDGILLTIEGQELLCSARGNPEPELKWQSDDHTVISGVLLITKDVVDGSFYNCTATNDHGVDSMRIQIFVLYGKNRT